jgi:hypothetical protein
MDYVRVSWFSLIEGKEKEGIRGLTHPFLLDTSKARPFAGSCGLVRFIWFKAKCGDVSVSHFAVKLESRKEYELE